MKYTFPFVEEMLLFLQVGNYASAFRALVENQSAEARLCCEFLLKYIVYSLSAAKEIGCDMVAADDVMAAGFHWCPPLALVEAISTIIDIEKLCEERLEPKIVDKIKTQQLLTGTERSRYDYRKFVLAKR